MDVRNERLATCLQGSGISAVAAWGELFKGKASFAVFSYQDWVAWVRAHDPDGHWYEWQAWIAARYAL